MIASPSYLEKHGRPASIGELNEHKLLHFSDPACGNVWKITTQSGETRELRTSGWLSVNDRQSLLNACIAGLGIAYLPAFLYRDALAEGAVEEVMPDLPVATLDVYATYPPDRLAQPKVRVFLDFLLDRIGSAVPKY